MRNIYDKKTDEQKKDRHGKGRQTEWEIPMSFVNVNFELWQQYKNMIIYETLQLPVHVKILSSNSHR